MSVSVSSFPQEQFVFPSREALSPSSPSASSASPRLFIDNSSPVLRSMSFYICFITYAICAIGDYLGVDMLWCMFHDLCTHCYLVTMQQKIEKSCHGAGQKSFLSLFQLNIFFISFHYIYLTEIYKGLDMESYFFSLSQIIVKMKSEKWNYGVLSSQEYAARHFLDIIYLGVQWSVMRLIIIWLFGQTIRTTRQILILKLMMLSNGYLSISQNRLDYAKYLYN